MEKELNERELEDNYPVRFGYLYVLDGEVKRSAVNSTVAILKSQTGVKSIKNCDIGGRDIWEQTV